MTPVGVSIEEINQKGDEIVNDALIKIMLSNDKYIYLNSALSQRMSNLDTQIYRYNVADAVTISNKYLTSKTLGQFVSGVLPDELSYVTDIVKYEASKEINITINQITKAGNYNYLIYGNNAREDFVNKLDSLFDLYLNENIDVYEDPQNNELLESRILTNIIEVKMINVNYKESVETYKRFRNSIMEEINQIYQDKAIENFYRIIHGPPST